MGSEDKSRVGLVSWSLLVVVVAVAVLLVVRAHRASEPAAHEASDPLLLVPPGPRLLISVDVAALMRVAAGDLARLGGDQLLGLRETCGFEPLLALERVVFAMPFGDAEGKSRGADFALLAASHLEPERALNCAERVIQKRGGSPVRAALGDFTSVRDRGKPMGELAIRADGLFVLSGGQYFRDVMDVAAGVAQADEAATLRTRLHRSIRDELGAGQLMLTLLPEAGSVLRGVLALGLRLQVGADLALRGLVACASVEDCANALAVVERGRAELAKQPGLSGLSNVRVEQRKERLELSGRLPRDQLGALLTQLVTP